MRTNNAEKHAEITKAMHQTFYNEIRANKGPSLIPVYGIMEYEKITNDDKPYNIEEIVFIKFDDGDCAYCYSIEDMEYYLHFELSINYWEDKQLQELMNSGEQHLICEYLNNHYKDCGAYFDYQTKIHKRLIPDTLFQDRSAAYQYLSKNKEKFSNYACVVNNRVNRNDLHLFTFLDTNN